MSLSKSTLPIFLLPFVMASLAGAQQASAERATPRYVRSMGSASIAVKPDQAEISIGVVSEAVTAQEAAAANAAQTAKVLEQLKKAAGANSEIRTLSYTVHPRYQHNQGAREPQIVGFTATNMLNVKLNEIEKVGGLIDAATQTGANQIHGIQFTIRDEQAARAKALQQATKEAMANAAAMAAGAGAKLGRVHSIEEQGSGPIQPLRSMAMVEARAASTPVEPGAVEITASVTMTVEIE
jgi:hypothetical protein